MRKTICHMSQKGQKKSPAFFNREDKVPKQNPMVFPGEDGDYFNDLFEFNIPEAHWTRPGARCFRCFLACWTNGRAPKASILPANPRCERIILASSLRRLNDRQTLTLKVITWVKCKTADTVVWSENRKPKDEKLF